MNMNFEQPPKKGEGEGKKLNLKKFAKKAFGTFGFSVGAGAALANPSADAIEAYNMDAMAEKAGYKTEVSADMAAIEQKTKTIKFEEKFDLEGGDSDLDFEIEFLSSTPDDFSVFDKDSIPDNSAKYGWKFMGTKKMLNKTIDVGYYGTFKHGTRTDLMDGPFRAEKKDTDNVYLLCNLIPSMGDYALFYNFSPNGDAHLVELSASLPVFSKDGKIYAVICGNRLVLDSVGPVEEAPKKVEVEKKKPEVKKEKKICPTKTMYLVKMKFRSYYYQFRQQKVAKGEFTSVKWLTEKQMHDLALMPSSAPTHGVQGSTIKVLHFYKVIETKQVPIKK